MSDSGSAVGQSAPDVRADMGSFARGGDVLPEGGVVPNPRVAETFWREDSYEPKAGYFRVTDDGRIVPHYAERPGQCVPKPGDVLYATIIGTVSEEPA